MESFDETKILRFTDSLPNWKRVAFMAFCCERMLPNYRMFQTDTGYGDVSLLRNALDVIWEWIETDKRPENADDLALACERQSPDTGEFPSKYTSAALDAASSVVTTLAAITEATASGVIEVASFARDTIDLFVQQQENLDPNALDLEEQIITNDLMQKELRIQRESLQLLNNKHGRRKEIGIELRAHWSKLAQGSLPGVA